MKYFLISYVLLYGGEIREASRIEFQNENVCENIKNQLQKENSGGAYAFECRGVKE